MNNTESAYLAMWIDSEDPIPEKERTWAHLAIRDKWKKPHGAIDEHVLFMSTSMETLIASDHATLKEHYGSRLREGQLPPLAGIEERDRYQVLKALQTASQEKYQKGRESFEILGKLNPQKLDELPSFKRARRILDEKLKPQN